MAVKNNIRDWVFHQVHSKNLVYNTCWEDPRCDRILMDFDADSDIVMITSAGCNALDYLLDEPNSINCIDVNYRQNSLLQLKLATFQNADFDTLFKIFGKGAHENVKEVYNNKLRGALPAFAQEFWDNNLNYINGKGMRKSLYHYGTSGTFAWMMNKYLKTKKKLYNRIKDLFEAKTLEEQSRIYQEVEPKISNKIVEWIVNRHFTMCLLGVPRSQQLLFMEKYERGALDFINECLSKVFTKLPIKDNYFWRLYFYGEYTKDCCPSYLEEKNFASIQAQANKIQTHTTYLSDFLKENPKAYSHYILLDHQDWLAENNIPALEEEWQLILKNSRPGTKILLRSAASEVDFFPEFVLNSVTFEKEKTAETHFQDRVGTYASVYLATVK